MPFGVAAAAIAAAGGIAGGIMQSRTAGGAQSAAQAALAQQRNDLGPWRTTGGQALGATADLLGLNGPDAANAAFANYQTSPGYQWQLQQGLRAVDAGQAAQGMLRSGATLKAEQTYGQGLADQDFSDYYSRLSGISQLGANAAAAGSQTAVKSAATTLGGANAQNSIYGNVFSNLGGTANTLLNNPGFQSWLKGSGTGAVTPTPAFDPNLYGYAGA